MDSARGIARRAAEARRNLRLGDIAGAEREAAALRQEFPDQPDGFALSADCAAARADWDGALLLWQECRQRGPGRPEPWRLGLAMALMNTGRLEEAEIAYADALADQPDLLPALGGRAVAVSRLRPAEAEALWRDVERRKQGALQPGWTMARAQALAASGNPGQALALVRALLGAKPDFAPALGLLSALLMRLGRRAEAEAEINSGILSPDSALSAMHRLRLLNWLGDVPAARTLYAAALANAASVQELTGVFETVPLIFEAFSRQQEWRTLRTHVQAIAQHNAPRARCLSLRIDLALRDYDGFLARHDAGGAVPAPWEQRFRRVAEILRSPHFPDFAAPRVFGIGLSKTGTVSLNRALERLGLLSAHFQNPFSNACLQEEDFALFDAATDTPVALRFETLHQLYPNARFILTERPFDDWLASITDLFERQYGTADFVELRRHAGPLGASPFGSETVQIQTSLYYNFADARAAWNAHAQRVDRFFADKPGKLLRHDVFRGDGWAELCGFLGCETPPDIYPWANRSGVS